MADANACSMNDECSCVARKHAVREACAISCKPSSAGHVLVFELLTTPAAHEDSAEECEPRELCAHELKCSK